MTVADGPSPADGDRLAGTGDRWPANGARDPAAIARRRLVDFPQQLRRAGVTVDAAASADFLTALTHVRPESLEGFQRLARLTLVRRPEDFGVFDAVFAAHFLGAVPPSPQSAADEEEISESDQMLGADGPVLVADGAGGGRSTSLDEGRGRRAFGSTQPSETQQLLHFSRTLAETVPPVTLRRRQPSPRGDRLDLRRILANARRTGGEAVRLFHTARPKRPRRLLVLVDVSGSLKEHSPRLLRIARAAVRSPVRTEAFTFATRLTRVTKALARRDGDAALSALAGIVGDADGGTRIGASLTTLLADPRHQALMRGAVVVVVSDGLERGDPEEMRHGVERLARLAFRLIFLTPLAASPDYRPQTRAMRAIAPHLDLLDDATSIPAFTRAAAALPALARAPRGRAFRASSLERHS